jgi:nucleoside-diphosphate-sugar epimerase
VERRPAAVDDLSPVRILVTGHDGYIGSVLMPAARDRGHDVVGLDSFLYEGCDFGRGPDPVDAIRRDIRDVEAADLEGFDAIVHLAAISNDPMGDLDPTTTYEVNHAASVRLARLAKDAGVRRFVFSSSCSLYGTATQDDLLTEQAAFNPVTPYGESKVLVERDVSALADDRFSPTFLRNATVYGDSPRLRLDLVVNDLVAAAHTTGQIVMRSDGTPWRPLVHVEDVVAACLAALEAPRERVHTEAFNIGRNAENYRVRDVAERVAEVVPGSRPTYAEGAGPDPRSYRVDFSKAERELPGFRPTWTLAAGIEQLRQAYEREGLDAAAVQGPRFVRLRRIRELVGAGELDTRLRWSNADRQVSASVRR